MLLQDRDLDPFGCQALCGRGPGRSRAYNEDVIGCFHAMKFLGLDRQAGRYPAGLT